MSSLRRGKKSETDVFPSDYNKQASPGVPGSPAHLHIDLSVLDIDRIDESHMEFSIQFYLREIWKDNRLNLSCFLENNNSQSNTAVPDSVVNRLWTPDLIFDNAKSGVLFGLSVPNRFIAVLRNGLIYRSSRYNLVIGCNMNFEYYPMDVQECFLKLALMSNPERKVIMRWTTDDEHLCQYFSGASFTHDIQSLKKLLIPVCQLHICQKDKRQSTQRLHPQYPGGFPLLDILLD
ncbi:gamma-aminobutyric acid receptor subunit rho-3 [Nephila pilipes]|uniref:Gamma-aminobutyric acid receptor subunit rho-3 n=1 Tax=Nephila pilipes TaxID=299642 RepID=A0A8X6TQK0_NEPPI|nr:gamma-aminobutyric acid receptor subunit rho-3 [Nephila pilipes]